MNMYSTAPKNWRSLQQKVFRIFKDIGFEAEIQKTVQTARGKVEVDVFADRDKPIRMVILAECKHWTRSIPKSVVHAFSKVVQDYGANLGYIISKVGFNAGAYDAAKFTNVRLLTWEEFKNTFEIEWLKSLSPRVSEDFRLLMDCTEPLIATSVFKIVNALPKREQAEFTRLRNEFCELGSLATTVAVFAHAEDFFGMKFPIRLSMGKRQFKITSTWELVDWIYAQGTKAQQLFSRVLGPRQGRGGAPASVADSDIVSIDK
jgi:restriction system protein